MLWEIGWQCSGGLQPCSFGSSAVPTWDRDDNDDVVFGSDDLLPAAAPPPLSSISSSAFYS